MDQIYMAFAEAVLHPIEERFGRPAAAFAALMLALLPIAGIAVAVWLVT